MRQRVLFSVLLFLGVALGYMANGRTIGAGDTLPARYLPWSLLRYHRVDLDPFPMLYGEEARRGFPLLDGVPYYLRSRDGHYLSAYTPGPAVAALPVYALPVLAGGVEPASRWAPGLEKLSAALITSASVVVLFRALAALVSRRWALGIALIYAFGSSSLSVSSQGLWQHGPSQLFVALLLYCLARGVGETRHLAYAGFAMAAAVVMRSTDLLLVLPVAVWIVSASPRILPRFALCAALPLAALLAYNLLALGSFTGDAGLTRVPTWALFSQVPLHEGLPGLLVSPSRGLFVYSPVFLFSLAGCLSVWRQGPSAFRALSLGVPLVVLVVSKWFLWWGGHSWGPRLLADTAPIFCFFLYPLAQPLSRSRLLRGVFVASIALSIGAHAMGALFYDGRWDSLADVDRDRARLWSWREGPLVFYGREALSAGRQLVSPVLGAQATSASAPAQLGGALAAEAIPREVLAGEPIPVSVTARNTGGAVWLASAAGDRGAVRLGWRWHRGDREEPGGRAPLLSDVSPGQSVRLTARVPAPAVPGDYVLLVDLVSEHVTWFAERGSKPLRAPVRILPVEIDRLLSAPIPSGRPAPAVTIASDRSVYRRGDGQHLTVTLAYPDRPRKFDAYLVLEGAGGTALIYDGRGMSPVAETPWRAWVKELPLPAQATGRFTPSLSGLPAGEYRWHAVLTEPGTYRAVVRATAAFRIES